MPYIATETLVGAALVIVLALGYQYLPTSTASTSTKSKKKNKKKTKTPIEEILPNEPAPKRKKGKGKPKDIAKTEKHVDSTTNSSSEEEGQGTPLVSAAPVERKPKTLAERIAPKNRKTRVDDMLAPEDLPATHKRVMRVVDPSAPKPPPPAPIPLPTPIIDEKVSKFEEDYVSSSEDETSGTTGTVEAEDDGWNVIAKKKPVSISLGSASTSTHTSQPLPVSTKLQRKNQKKTEAKKAAKVAEEAERQRRLAMHKRDLEREKINDIYAANKKAAGKSTRGTASATVDNNGKLIWD